MSDKWMNLHPISVTDFLSPELDVYARMTENQLLNRDHPEEGIFIAESPKVILRALQAGYEPISLLAEEKDLDAEMVQVLEGIGDIPIYTASHEVLKNLTGIPLTRGLLCAMRRKPLPTLKELCEGKGRIAVLENVMNPTNVGAIIRSAAALHMDAVILTDNCSNPLYRRAVRVSMGCVFQIPWTIVGEEWISELKSMGFLTAAMALKEDTISLKDPVLKKAEKLAIVLGSEGDGLPDATIDACDMTVMIPMSHGVDSLNVAAASAVAFWELGTREDK